jgi:hypothetical protein
VHAIYLCYTKQNKKNSSLQDFGFFGEEECFPRRYIPLVRWRFDSLLGEKPRAASEPLHVPPSSSPFAPNKSFVRLLRLPEFRLRISHTSKKEQLTGAKKERKNAKNLVQCERRHTNKVEDSRHHMQAILSNCPLVNTAVPQPCSLSLSFSLPTYLNTYLPDYLPTLQPTTQLEIWLCWPCTTKELNLGTDSQGPLCEW